MYIDGQTGSGKSYSMVKKKYIYIFIDKIHSNLKKIF